MGILRIFLRPTLQRKEQIKEIKECKAYAGGINEKI